MQKLNLLKDDRNLGGKRTQRRQQVGGQAPQQATTPDSHANDDALGPTAGPSAGTILALRMPPDVDPAALNSLPTTPVVCSSDHLEATKPRQGFGGKQACAIQREFRQQCFDQGVWEIDLTQTDVDWRSLLRAQPSEMRRRLLGPGIIKISFRLLQHVRDSNYAQRDSGERHVFEITRVNLRHTNLPDREKDAGSAGQPPQQSHQDCVATVHRDLHERA